MLKNKIIIIGGNAAGCAAAAKAKRVNPNAEIIIFEKSNYISTGTCELPYVLSGEIDDYNKLVFYTPETFLREKGVRVYNNTEIKSIDRRKKTVTTTANDEYAYDSLILAAGSTAKTLPDSSLYQNIFTLKNINDIAGIQHYFSEAQPKNALIIGSGYIGLEIAGALAERKCNVTIIEKAKSLLPSAEEEISILIRELLQKNTVAFYTECDNYKLIGSNNKISAVKIGSRILDVDVVITALGFHPNTLLAIASHLDIGVSGGIKVNNKLQTSDPNIFAAGDVIEYPQLLTRKSAYIPLATLARTSGYIAGTNAVGGNEFISPVVKNISVKIFNKYFVQVGLTTEEVKKHGFTFEILSIIVPNKVKVMPGWGNTFAKVVVEKNTNRILGASFFGDSEVSGYGDIIALCIRKRIPFHEFQEMNFNYTPPLSPFVNPLVQLSKKLKR